MGEIINKLKRIAVRDGKNHCITINQEEARQILKQIRELEKKLEATEIAAMKWKELYEIKEKTLDIEYLEDLVDEI